MKKRETTERVVLGTRLKKPRRRPIFFARKVIPNSITFSPTAAVRRALLAVGGPTSDIINAAIIFTLAKP